MSQNAKMNRSLSLTGKTPKEFDQILQASEIVRKASIGTISPLTFRRKLQQFGISYQPSIDQQENINQEQTKRDGSNSPFFYILPMRIKQLEMSLQVSNENVLSLQQLLSASINREAKMADDFFNYKKKVEESLSRMTQKLNDMSAELEKKKKTLEENNQLILKKQRQLNASQTLSLQLASKIDQLNEKNKILEYIHKQAHNKSELSTQQSRLLFQENQALREEKQRMAASFENLEFMISERDERINRYLQEKQYDNQIFVQRQRDLTSQIEIMKQEITTYLKQNRTFQQANSQYRSQLHELQRAIHQLGQNSLSQKVLLSLNVYNNQKNQDFLNLPMQYLMTIVQLIQSNNSSIRVSNPSPSFINSVNQSVSNSQGHLQIYDSINMNNRTSFSQLGQDSKIINSQTNNNLNHPPHYQNTSNNLSINETQNINKLSMNQLKHEDSFSN